MISKKFTLKVKESPMTIVVAIKESDSSLLLAGDTGAFEPSLNLRFDNMPKLFYHPKGILAWGYSGSPTIVDERFHPVA